MKQLLLLLALTLAPFASENLFVIREARTIDNNGDGLCDQIEVSLLLSASMDALRADDITDVSVAMDGSSAAVSHTALMVEGAAQLTVEIMPEALQGSGTITLDTPEGTVTGTLTDRIGPVATAAFLTRHETAQFDTLRLRCSEEVLAEETEVHLRQISTMETTELRAQVQEAAQALVLILEKGALQESDSISLLPQGGISDLLGNSPAENSQKIAVAIEYKTANISTHTSIAPAQLQGTLLTFDRAQPRTIAIYSNNGRELRRLQSSGKQFSLSELGLPSGIYQVAIEARDLRRTVPLRIE